MLQALCFRGKGGKVAVMKEVEVNQYKALLMARRAAITSKSRQREEICIVQSNEQIETVQLAGQREFAALSLERQTKVLGQIEAALERIHDGEFGICLDCEEPISPKRLAAVPWAAYCLQCQESHDAQEGADTVEPKLAA
jgi:DnaK suppressor protein